jgi:hypothetical protein
LRQGAPPANGTVTKLTPSACLNISIASDGVPAPGDATLYLPGLAFIKSIKSIIVLARNSGLTCQEFGEAPALVTGMKSFSTSNGIDLYRLGFTTILAEASRRPRSGCHADIAAGTANVLDEKLLTETRRRDRATNVARRGGRSFLFGVG